jgi:hypothetical protein
LKIIFQVYYQEISCLEIDFDMWLFNKEIPLSTMLRVFLSSFQRKNILFCKFLKRVLVNIDLEFTFW